MIAVIDYAAGNLYNVGNALRHLGADFVFTSDPGVVKRADRVILPGVGAAQAAMSSLAGLGLVPALKSLKTPFLGICLGLQLLFEGSEEEDARCLGVMPGRIRRFDSSRLKTPQIGWNQVECDLPLLFKGVPSGASFYFVHSYYAPVQPGITRGTTEYGVVFASVVARDNFLGVQFHPERSGELGLRVLRNFLEVEC